ncbi:MAG: nucleotidyltransferase domain-containing protein [Patescibacteria group bacterium]
MNKEEIKTKIKEAIECNPLRDDIQKVSLFGSYINSAPRQDSDVDILIEFTPSARIGFFKLAQIRRDMEQFVKKPIDLLTPEAISRFFREQVIKESEIVYEK